MRRTGRTTRRIDSVIQKFFERGEIWLLSATQIKNWITGKSRGLNKDRMDESVHYVDHEYHNGAAQSEFIKRIISRLENEHEGSFKIEVRDGFTIIRKTK